MYCIAAVAQNVQSAAPSSATVASQQSAATRIGSGDQLDMAVFNVPELTQRQRVDENGNYSVPLLGPVHVAGLTLQQAQTAIASKMEAGHYLKGASVSLFVSDFATQGVSVMGEVNKPGVYPVWGERRLFNMIAEAGGTTSHAGKFAMITHRDSSAAAQNVAYALGNPQDPNSNPIVAPGDTILITKTGIVYVLGDVNRPGGYPLDDKGSLTLMQAVALAQGTTITAKLGSARLVRNAPSGRKEIAVNMKNVLKGRDPDLSLQGDDILYVPSSMAKTIANRTLPQIVAATTNAAIYTGIER
jgi:polysaccharide export outer membrane protein